MKRPKMHIGSVRPLSRLLDAIDKTSSFHRSLTTVALISLLPMVGQRALLWATWNSAAPRAWDGTGHYGIARIYDEHIFPETFGWTFAHFGGMPFPNFYPPLFFWCVSLLHHLHFFSFAASFKILILSPTLLMPAFIWGLALTVSDGNRGVAFWAALLSVWPLIDVGFGGHLRWSSGLDYWSTLAIGFYTQPLGFVLLIAWYITYLRAQMHALRFVAAGLLLALAVLGNYLSGVTSIIIVAATLLHEGLKYFRANAAERRQSLRSALVAHAVTPLIALALTLFWIVPMISTYSYFVTRPFTQIVVTKQMAGWFIFAAVGIICWLRRPSDFAASYVIACSLLAVVIFLAAIVSPRGYPLQANRLVPTLNFLLAVPVAYAVWTALKWLRHRLAMLLPRARTTARRAQPLLVGVLLVGLGFGLYAISKVDYIDAFLKFQSSRAFYPPPGGQVANGMPADDGLAKGPPVTVSSVLDRKPPSQVTSREVYEMVKQEHRNDIENATASAATIKEVLDFAHDHRDGRYLVELPDIYDPSAASYDSRALNSYLGAQGNETLSVVFREASPNSLFINPQINALSHSVDNFGFSSVLADDLDFAEQPLAKHLERARLLGTRYLVIHSPEIKTRLAAVPEVGARRDFGAWSVFELKQAPPPLVAVLPFRPALVVSNFTLKERRTNERNFIRYAEEQFADGWFDVLLVHTPADSLDDMGSLSELRQFGAVILDSYDCTRCELVYRQLREYAQNRPLILLSTDTRLFNRIKASIKDFPFAEVIERLPEGPGAWLENSEPSRRYSSSKVRSEWEQIKQTLDRHKIATGDARVVGQMDRNFIRIDPGATSGALSADEKLPVLIGMSYHPNWRRQDGNAVYAATPMFTLTFVDQPTVLTFERRPLDRLGVWISASTLFCLLLLTAWRWFREVGAAGHRRKDAG